MPRLYRRSVSNYIKSWHISSVVSFITYDSLNNVYKWLIEIKSVDYWLTSSKIKQLCLFLDVSYILKSKKKYIRKLIPHNSTWYKNAFLYLFMFHIRQIKFKKGMLSCSPFTIFWRKICLKVSLCFINLWNISFGRIRSNSGGPLPLICSVPSTWISSCK